jgi:hypothetical protein
MSALLIPLLFLTMAGVLAVLILGMVGLVRGGADPMRSNRLMRWRVILQAAALLIAIALMALVRS